MPRLSKENAGRISIKIRPEDKALLLRAVAYENTDLPSFLLRNAMKAAKESITQAEQIKLSDRDSLAVLSALENPPAPNSRLIAVAKDLPRSIK